MKNPLVKFIAKALLFLMLLTVADRGIGFLFVKAKDCGLQRNPENIRLKTAFVYDKVHADVLVIGSSRASHHYVAKMMEDTLGLSVYNCGQNGSFFLYQHCIVNLLLDRYRPKSILWDIQPGSFNRADSYSEYYNVRFLLPYYADNVWVKSYVDGESEMMKYRLKSHMFAYNSNMLNYLFPLLVTGAKTEQGYVPIPNDGYRHPKMNCGDNMNAPFLHASRHLALLETTIKRCKQLNVDLQLFISPAYGLKNNAIIAAERDIENVARREGVAFYNYHSHPAFMADSSYFKDYQHLNDKGAHEYTALVLAAMNTHQPHN